MFDSRAQDLPLGWLCRRKMEEFSLQGPILYAGGFLAAALARGGAVLVFHGFLQIHF